MIWDMVKLGNQTCVAVKWRDLWCRQDLTHRKTDLQDRQHCHHSSPSCPCAPSLSLLGPPPQLNKIKVISKRATCTGLCRADVTLSWKQRQGSRWEEALEMYRCNAPLPENRKTYKLSCQHRKVVWLTCYQSVALTCTRCFRGMSETILILTLKLPVHHGNFFLTIRCQWLVSTFWFTSPLFVYVSVPFQFKRKANTLSICKIMRNLMDWINCSHEFNTVSLRVRSAFGKCACNTRHRCIFLLWEHTKNKYILEWEISHYGERWIFQPETFLCIWQGKHSTTTVTDRYCNQLHKLLR